jgi:intermembrane space import and assembly protein 40
MADGPCGEQFKAAFSCFVYSEAEPKGMDCVEKFKGMQDCFREHPEIYGEGMSSLLDLILLYHLYPEFVLPGTLRNHTLTIRNRRRGGEQRRTLEFHPRPPSTQNTHRYSTREQQSRRCCPKRIPNQG